MELNVLISEISSLVLYVKQNKLENQFKKFGYLKTMCICICTFHICTFFTHLQPVVFLMQLIFSKKYYSNQIRYIIHILVTYPKWSYFKWWWVKKFFEKIKIKICSQFIANIQRQIFTQGSSKLLIWEISEMNIVTSQ